ncbi:MAG: hypothetical protein ACPGYP_06050 [Solirubrobacterales bacterium]
MNLQKPNLFFGLILVTLIAGCGSEETTENLTSETGSCMNTAVERLTFPATAINNPLGAENGSDPPNEALNSYLNGPRSAEDRVSPSGWRELRVSDEDALFGWEAPNGQTERVILVKREPNGSWLAQPSVGCQARYFFTGQFLADLTLNRSSVKDDGRKLELKAEVPWCAVSDSPRVVVSETKDEVLVRATFSKDKPSDDGSANCIGIWPAKSVNVTLNSPIGERKLLDSSFLVPRAIR